MLVQPELSTADGVAVALVEEPLDNSAHLLQIGLCQADDSARVTVALGVPTVRVQTRRLAVEAICRVAREVRAELSPRVPGRVHGDGAVGHDIGVQR